MNTIFKNLCRGTISHVSIIRDNSSLRAVPGKISGALFVGDLKKVLKNLNTTFDVVLIDYSLDFKPVDSYYLQISLWDLIA